MCTHARNTRAFWVKKSQLTGHLACNRGTQGTDPQMDNVHRVRDSGALRALNAVIEPILSRLRGTWKRREKDSKSRGGG